LRITNPAQNYFFQLQAGTSHVLSENVRYYSLLEADRPIVLASVGKFFYPQFGMRFSAGWAKQVGFVDKNVRKNTPPGYDTHYTYNIAQAYVDGLFDMHSFFFGVKEKRRFSLLTFLGVGYIRTFGFSDMAEKWNERHWYLTDLIGEEYRNRIENYIDENGLPATRHAYAYYTNTKSRSYFAGHLGLIANYKINDAWDIHLEGSFNATDDEYNGVSCRRVYDGYINVLAGVSYHIKDKMGARRYKYSYYTDADLVETINHTIEETTDSLKNAEKPLLKVMERVIDYDEMIQTTIEFYRDKYYVTEAQMQNIYSVASFIKSHPELTVTVIGYADVQTAYPAYNMKLSKRRAETVYNILVKECKVDPSHLRMEWKGDTEQPYQMVNDWNRAVIFKVEK